MTSTAAMVRAKRPGEYHHGDLRQALVDAALTLIERDGPAGLTLRGAARLAGVSRTAPYRHFKDKQALLAATAEAGFRAFARGFVAAEEASSGTPPERLRALGRAYVGFAVAHPSQYRVMFGPEFGDKADYPELLEAAQAAFGHLLSAVADCRAAGLLRDGPVDEMTLAAWSMIHGLSNLMLDRQLRALGLDEEPTEELADRICRYALGSLGLAY